MNVGEVLLHAVQTAGAEEIFGIPGDFALPLFKVFEETGTLPLYTLSHEPGLGFAADAAARFSGRPAVAAVTYGAGAFNILNPIAAAYAEKSPVIVISGGPGQADRRTGLGVHHQAKRLRSQLEIFREVTCAQTVLDDAEEAPGRIARVLSACLQQSRPVYIEVPRDQVFTGCEPVPEAWIQRASPSDSEAVAACAEEILERLERARSPVLVIGVEIRRFGVEQQAGELARRLGIDAATTFMGRGLLASMDDVLSGTYVGLAGDEALTQRVESSDALFLLGVLLSDTNFGISARQIDMRKAILACDGHVSIGYHDYPQIPIAALINELVGRLPEQRAGSPRTRAAPCSHELPADAEPILPADIAAGINELFAGQGAMPIAADMGDCLFTAFSVDNTELVAPGYYATMGYGVPAGIGVQIVSGRRSLILVGDGAFQMTGWELLNCPRYGLDPICIVFNNSSWEMLRAFQPESRFNDLDTLDFAAIAGTLGGDGHRAETRAELSRALHQAASTHGRFQLIDARIPRGTLSPTLQRFVDGFKQMRGGSGGG